MANRSCDIGSRSSKSDLDLLFCFKESQFSSLLCSLFDNLTFPTFLAQKIVQNKSRVVCPCPQPSLILKRLWQSLLETSLVLWLRSGQRSSQSPLLSGLKLKPFSGLCNLLRGNIGGISVWKVIPSSALTPSWTVRTLPYGLYLLWCLIFVCLLSLGRIVTYIIGWILPINFASFDSASNSMSSISVVMVSSKSRFDCSLCSLLPLQQKNVYYIKC